MAAQNYKITELQNYRGVWKAEREQRTENREQRKTESGTLRLSRAQRLLADYAEAEQPTLRSERITKLVWVVPSREEETQSVKSSCRRQVKAESGKRD